MFQFRFNISSPETLTQLLARERLERAAKLESALLASRNSTDRFFDKLMSTVSRTS